MLVLLYLYVILDFFCLILPFAIMVSLLAVIGFYELLKMRGISIFSVPGMIGVLGLLMLVVPNDWSKEIIQFLNYESNLMIIYGVAILLLIYIVLVKNKMTFDEVGFILLGAFYVGLGFHYFIETRFVGALLNLLSVLLQFLFQGWLYAGIMKQPSLGIPLPVFAMAIISWAIFASFLVFRGFGDVGVRLCFSKD